MLVHSIHQFVPTLAPRDAIGAHTVLARDVLRGLGYQSDIYASSVVRGTHVQAHAADRFPTVTQPGTWLLYQCSTGAPLADAMVARSEPLIVDYHNITPAGFFEPWEARVATELAAGRRQLAALAPRSALGLADSGFNRAELDAIGFAATRVAPVLVDVGALDRPADRRTYDRLRRDAAGAAWLFVGRLAPNKAQHDVIKAFAAYRRLFDPQARLRLVGASSSARYRRTLEQFVSGLGLAGAVELCGSVTPAQLVAHYRAAQVFVCLSDHEGFCVPLLEAMLHRLPVVAYGSSAVPETLGGAGLCLRDKDPITVAHAVRRVVSDDELRATMVERGTQRLGDLDLPVTSKLFAAAVTEVVDGR